MDLDSQHASQTGSTAPTSIILLVPQAELEAAQNRFLTPPQSHVYALHSTPLASTSDLSLHTLPLLSTEAHRAKWKPIPLGGYGEIVHPNGERKKSSSQTSKKSLTNKASTYNKSTLLGNKFESAKTSTSNSDIPSSRSTKKPAASTVRKIGQPGGLFARREPTPPPPVAPKVVPSKRKASPKKQQNGLFADEELASEDEEEDDLWDEEALREAEEIALKGDSKTKAPATAVETKKKETAPAPKKAAAPAKKFGAGSSTTGGAKAGTSKPAKQKGIGSFFTKQA
ncbi:hypothetical protein MVLG_02028 [Microbotryum lychnidis-dioicae p1A1 Lamole]|uniref:DNA polymerase delta subunit 3 n=1 Tax=Microbotryum lychnidis-dioicae (strain p1A1 Lamole / MvSl-1064) TaxID=683840 RepID=U5H3X5_USTV1|nr:hypothetical protein MVLG_02028 [Microbotryum lychnidis-dioicae p1A1 Lamole]|eukprot:KDE07758.1 hypothetical protein MVLG_02028 [Microbotryum lychnidis-dioicae p1A1 Lamole]